MRSFLKAILLPAILASCHGSEVEGLKAENARLRSEMAKLESENKTLKATADYHFRVGQDYLASKDWGAAITSFQTVLDKYPNDSLVGPSRESLAQAEQARNTERARRAEEERVANADREKEMAESGGPIAYGAFYAKSKTGLTVGKRYRFSACLDQYLFISSREPGVRQSIGIVAQFDDRSEYERWLSSGKDHCGTIVASMLWDGHIAVHRLH